MTVHSQSATYSQFFALFKKEDPSDGNHLVYSIYTGQSDLWLMDGLRQSNWLDRLREAVLPLH
jgi:hypothetical protein